VTHQRGGSKTRQIIPEQVKTRDSDNPRIRWPLQFCMYATSGKTLSQETSPIFPARPSRASSERYSAVMHFWRP